MEVDYWGLGNRTAVERILVHDKRPIIRVSSGSAMNLYGSLLAFKAHQRERFQVLEDPVSADYIITNYRPPYIKDEDFVKMGFRLSQEKRILGNRIFSVYEKEY